MAANTLFAAIAYARLGLRVLPIAPGGKIPVTARGVHDASSDPVEIGRLWRGQTGANVGIACGPESGVWMLDVDTKHGVDGFATLRALGEAQAPIPDTWTVVTPSLGAHMYFRHPARPIRNRVGVAPGLDVRAAGGFAVAPPSTRPDGRYVWLTSPREALADAPEWLLELIDPPAPPRVAAQPVDARSLDKLVAYVAAAVDGEARAVATAPLGARNGQLFKSACRMGELIGADLMPEALAVEVLEHGAAENGLAGADGPRAVRATIQSGLRKGMANPREVFR